MDKGNKFSGLAALRKGVLILLALGLPLACAPSLVVQLESDIKPPKYRGAKVLVTHLKSEGLKEPVLVDVSEKGDFYLTNLEKGAYLIEIMAPGYKLKTHKIEIKGSTDLKLKLEALTDTELSIFKIQKNRKASAGQGDVRLNLPSY